MSPAPTGFVRRVALAAGLPVVGAIGTLGAYFAWLPRLPARIASHFGAGGRADDFVDVTVFPFALPGLMLGMAVLFGGLAVAIRDNPQGQRITCAASGGVGLMLLVVNVLLLRANLDVVDPATVVFPGWIIGLMAGGLVAGAALGWISAGRMPVLTVDPPAARHEPSRVLTAEEAVRWQRVTASPPTWWVMLALVPLTLATSTATSWWMLTIFIPIVVLLAATSRADVAIDDSGLTVRLLTPWPRIRVPLGEIRTVHSHEVNALGDFGGWGWRSNRTASGLVLRSGPALWIYRKQQGPLVITVPDANEAAALLNGLRDRRDST